MLRNQLREQFSASRRNLHQRTPMVALIGNATHQAGLLCPINQLDRAVMPNHHTLGDVGDRSFLPRRDRRDHLQYLVLLRRNSHRLRSGLTKAQKPPQPIPKLSQFHQFRRHPNYSALSFRRHIYRITIISYSDVYPSLTQRSKMN